MPRTPGCCPASAAASPHARPTAKGLDHERTLFGLFVKVIISEQYEATGIEKENGSKPMPGCPGINPTAVASLAEDRITTTSVGSKKKKKASSLNL